VIITQSPFRTVLKDTAIPTIFDNPSFKRSKNEVIVAQYVLIYADRVLYYARLFTFQSKVEIKLCLNTECEWFTKNIPNSLTD